MGTCVLLHITTPVILLQEPLPPHHPHLSTQTHVAYIHASTLWCTYTRWLRLYSLVGSFEEPPPWTADSISFALIISHKCCVWLRCPRLLYARHVSYRRSPCVTYTHLWNWLLGKKLLNSYCVNKYRRFSHVHNIWCCFNELHHYNPPHTQKNPCKESDDVIINDRKQQDGWRVPGEDRPT